MVHTENVLTSPSNAKVSDYNGVTDNQGVGSDIGTWDGSQTESAKEHNSFDFWDDED